MVFFFSNKNALKIVKGLETSSEETLLQRTLAIDRFNFNYSLFGNIICPVGYTGAGGTGATGCVFNGCPSGYIVGATAGPMGKTGCILVSGSGSTGKGYTGCPKCDPYYFYNQNKGLAIGFGITSLVLLILVFILIVLLIIRSGKKT